MQVNRATFPATFEHFVSLLATCDFYALDEEMTGINTSDVTESVLDSPAASYEAKRLAASRYSIMQCGICLFHRVESKSEGDGATAPPRWHYVARPFNFILFPQAMGDSAAVALGEARVPDISISPSAFAFLQRHKMNFQTWVYDGIAFCDRHHEAAYLATTAEESGPSSDGSALLLDADKAWVDSAMARAASLSAESPVVTLPPVQSRAARDCLRASLAQSLPAVSVAFRRQPPSSGALYTAVLTLVPEAERARQAARAALRQRRAVLDALGFRHVFSALVASRKPCVGHNCFADFLFLLASLDGPLPGTLPLLKGRLHELFPCVFDTKYLSSCRADLFAPGRFASTHLGGLFGEYGLSSPRVCVTLPLGFQAYDALTTSSVAHEAGYDALMTGTVFANLLHEAGMTLEDATATLANKVALFRSLYAVDVSSAAAADEYVPDAAFLLAHRDGVQAQHVESCLEASAWRAAARVYTVDEHTSVAAFAGASPPPPTLPVLQQTLDAYVTVRPLDRPSGVGVGTGVGRFASPASPGLLRGTMPRLFMWRRLLTRH